MTDPAKIAVDDQVNAAQAEAEAIMNNVAREMGKAETETTDTRLYDRIAVRAKNFGPMKVCHHLEQPTVVWVAIARPDIYLCPECFQHNADTLLKDPARMDLCDLCDEPTKIFVETVLRLGPIMWFGNLCRECRKLAPGEST